VNAPLVLAAGCAGAAVGLVTVQLVRPRRYVVRRFLAYTEVSRSRLGGDVASFSQPALYTEATRRVLGPLAAGMGAGLARLLGLGEGGDLERRLRQAGYPMSASAYGRLHLRWAFGAPVGLGVLGVLTGSASLTVGFFLAGAIVGVRRTPDRLRSASVRRSARIRSDLPTVAAMLSPRIENRKSLMTAVAEVVREGSGPVIDDLSRALNLVAAGYGDAAAFSLLATETAEEAAARFYRFLAAATRGGIDLPRALLDHADALRLQRREEVERSAARRQMSMVLPDLVFMAPVLLLFLLAPVPRLLFGAG